MSSAKDTVAALKLQEKLLKHDLQLPVAAPIEGSVIDADWLSSVQDIRSFLDEDYSVPLSGGGYAQRNLAPGSSQLPWGRIGIDKWSDRVIPLLNVARGELSSRWQAVISIIKQACRDAVAFGNATIVVDADGELRVSTPETAVATKTPFSTTFVEDFGTVKTMAGDDGVLLISRDNDEYVDSGAMVFSIF